LRDYLTLIKYIGIGNYNAGIIFDATNYCLHKDGTSQEIFFATDEEDPKKFKGLGMIGGKVAKLILKKKSDLKGKIKFKFIDHKEIWPVTINEFNIYVDEQ